MRKPRWIEREGLKAIEDRAMRADMLEDVLLKLNVLLFHRVDKMRLGMTEQLPREV